MKTNINPQNYILILMQVTFFWGCSGGFQLTSSTEIQNSTVLSSEATSTKQLVQSDEGSLVRVGSDKQGKFSFEMKVPFGAIHRMGSKLIKFAAPFSCQFAPGISHGSPLDYRDGEIPCGGIIDQNWKQLMVINIDPISGVANDFNYSFSGVSLPVYLNRQALSGSYSEFDLTQRSVVNRSSSLKYLEDISLKYTPEGTRAKFELCLNFPGAQIKSSSQVVSGKTSKKVLGVKLSYGTDFDIYPGQASFDYARGCFQVELGTVDGQLSPELQILATEPPHLANAVYAGVQIKTRDFLLNLIENILSIFKISVRKQVENNITQKVNSVTDQELESGRWFSRVHGEQLLQDTGERVTAQMSSLVTRLGVPATTDDLKQMIADSCRLRLFSEQTSIDARIERFCRDVVSKVEVNVQPFSIDENEKALGCYSGFARIHDSAGAWWQDQCHLSAKFEVTLPLNFVDYQPELEEILSSRFKNTYLPLEWKNKMLELGIDELSLMQALQVLESRGIKQIQTSDWQTLVKTVLQEIRETQAQ